MDQDDENHSLENSSTMKKQRSLISLYTTPKSHSRRYLFVLGSLIFTNLIFLYINLSAYTFSRTTEEETSYSPARSSVTYSGQSSYSADHHAESAYSGYPDESNNKAWEELIYLIFFNATSTEVLKAGNSPSDSVLLAEGGHVAALGVYHELHCLRRFRLFLYAPVYYPDMTPANLDYLQKHLDHCLETIRQSVMCTADLSLYNFHWGASSDDRPRPETHSMRKCANWDNLHTWAKTRRVDYDPVLVRLTGKKERVHL